MTAYYAIPKDGEDAPCKHCGRTVRPDWRMGWWYHVVPDDLANAYRCDFSGTDAYCMKCREVRVLEFYDVVEIQGRVIVRGPCSKCATVLSRIVGRGNGA